MILKMSPEEAADLVKRLQGQPEDPQKWAAIFAGSLKQAIRDTQTESASEKS